MTNCHKAKIWRKIIQGQLHYMKAIYLGSIIQGQLYGWQLFEGNDQCSIILRGNSLGFNCPRGANYLGDNYQGGNFLRGNYPGGNNLGGQLSWEAIVRGTIVQGAIIRGTIILFPFETNCSFHVKQLTIRKVQFLFFKSFLVVLTKVSFRDES